jgi:MFS family permease
VPYVSIPHLITVYGAILLFTTTARFFGIHDLGRPARAAALPKIRAALDARVGWYIVTFTLVNMAFGICFGPYFTILAHDVWKNTDSEINLLFALGSAASLLGIPFGQRADRWDTQRVVTIGLFVFAITVAAWGLAPSWQWGIAPIVLAFFFSEGAIIAVLALQGQITTRESRASVMGVIATVSGVIAGLGPVLAAGLIQWGGNAAPFIACGVMSLIAIGAARRIDKSPRVPGVGAEAE